MRGDPKHFLNTCPKRPPPCLELVVSQLDDANLFVDVAGMSTGFGSCPTTWLAIVPISRAKPKPFSKKKSSKF